MHTQVKRRPGRLAIGTMVGLLVLACPAAAVTKESPEVRKLVDKGLEFLSTANSARLGGKCLIGLAFLKDGQPDHPKVSEALKACREARTSKFPIDVYNNGIAVIFLCELDSKRHSDLISFYLGALQRQQKKHGGWGYADKQTGDTSQTQYGTLGLWEAHQHRIGINRDAIAQCLDWVIQTQDPTGAWGYQGKIANGGQLVRQDEIRPSMVAAGLSSLLVCADLFGILSPGASDNDADAFGPPAGFRDAKQKKKQGRPKPLSASGVDKAKLFTSLRSGQQWFSKNFTIKVNDWNAYYLYSIERYKSFEELLAADVDPEPEWYNQGYEFLAKEQKENGSWRTGGGGAAVSTSFSVLFLLRSTQGTLRRSLGDGVLLGGRGVPTQFVRKKKIRVGNKLVDATNARLADMFALLDEGQSEALDQIASDPTAFVGGVVDDKTARRLQQIVRGGKPTARLLAVRSLGRTGKIDYAPTLLFALTDPDRRVTLEARNGLRFLSRRFEGYGLPDDYTDKQRYEALDKWKNWYLTFRPNAVLDF